MEQQRTLESWNKKKGFSWKSYNESQTKEKILFLKLLKELCDTLPQKYRTNKKKPFELSKVIFCLCLKSYCLKSGRRIISEIELCKRLGLIDKIPHFNTIFNYLKHPVIISIFQDLIKVSALPLIAVERKFCGDSTGIGTRILHDRWSQIRQDYSKHHMYMKLHASFGTLTNIVTSCRITNGNVNDTTMLPELVNETSENFTLKEYSFDKAYLSRNNLNKIWEKGCLPLIPFKANTKSKAKGSMIWKEMFEMFEKNNELFMKKYHLRSNAESGFFMIKQRFGDLTQMRDETGMINDILSKVLAHNLVVLCQEIFLLGVQINFAQFKEQLAQDRI